MGYWDYEPCELLHYSLKVSTLVLNICCSLGELRSGAGARECRNELWASALGCLFWSVSRKQDGCEQRLSRSCCLPFICLSGHPRGWGAGQCHRPSLLTPRKTSGKLIVGPLSSAVLLSYGFSYLQSVFCDPENTMWEITGVDNFSVTFITIYWYHCFMLSPVIRVNLLLCLIQEGSLLIGLYV